MTKQEILTAAATHREMEVMQHQINIDNYRMAIAEIEQNHIGEDHMEVFAGQLRELLKSSIQEQAKEAVLLKVIRMQLDGLSALSFRPVLSDSLAG